MYSCTYKSFYFISLILEQKIKINLKQNKNKKRVSQKLVNILLYNLYIIY
jgi:hypothetical protein